MMKMKWMDDTKIHDPECLQIPKNMFNNMKVGSAGNIHKLGNYMDCIGNVRMSHCRIS